MAGQAFPSTDWGLLGQVREGSPSARLAALDVLIRRYWRPVYLFLKRSGHDEESAKDLTQAFFAEWVEKEAFGKADSRKGRFRSFMLTCLKRFVSNVRRAEHAQRRRPVGGLVSLDELLDQNKASFDFPDNLTPDAIFNRSWASELVLRVLRRLEQECRGTGKEAHFDILRQRVMEPILHGAEAPPMAALAQQHGLTEKEAGNCLLTAKRAYQRLLKEEVRLYAESEAEVAGEIRDIFCILGG